MPEHYNSLSNAVADALKHHERNEEKAKQAARKLTLLQQIAAQVEAMQNAPISGDDEPRS